MTQEQKGKTPVLDVQNLTKIYDNGGKGDENEVLKNVNFTMNEGEFVCILGPSGCGKTTFLRCIGGFETFDGTVKVNGKEVSEPGTDRIMVFQDFNQLLPWKTVEKNVQYPLKIQGLKDKTKLREISDAALEKVDLLSSRTLYPHQLSGGMRQRVMIAMALACRPKLLIADEPTTALDVTIQAQILKLMNDLKKEKGTSILFITHDLGVINEMADDVAVMYCGQVVEKAPVRSIFGDNSYLHPYTEGLLYSIPRLDTPTGIRLEAIPGAVPHPLDLPKGCKFAPRCKYATDKCREMEPELNEVEPGHMVRCFYPKKGERN